MLEAKFLYINIRVRGAYSADLIEKMLHFAYVGAAI